MLIITGVKYKYWTFEITSKFYLFNTIATTIMSIIVRFFSRIFSPMFNKFKFILIYSFSVLNKLYISQYKIINFILYTFLGIISYLFFYDLTSIKVIRIFIFTLILLAVSIYISDNYTLSKNIFIKILQKLVFLILKLSLIVFILEILDLSIFYHIHCEPSDVDSNKIRNNLVAGLSDFYQYVESLTILEHSILLDILLFLLLILTVINILSALFANEIIRYFNLETRFPRLSIFFKVRSNLQRYYLMWNVFVLMFVCIFGICINIVVFVLSQS